MTQRRDQEGQENRRHGLRRERDLETYEIVERAGRDAPFISRILHGGKVASACLALGAVAGSAGSLAGIGLVGPRDHVAALARRVDADSARLDRMISTISEMQRDVGTVAFIQCVQLRRTDPTLRPKGCDAAVARGTP